MKQILIASLLYSISSFVAAETLYQSLGEENGVAALSDVLIINIMDDHRINAHFEDANLDNLHQMLSAQICNISGGGCEYLGENMRDAHKGMKITESEFNAVVENLWRSMEQLRIPVPTQNKLIKLLAKMRADILYR